MFAVRIHGRGGQGAVTAAELLSVAAFDEGRHAQAFPTFGSERTGAPVVSFCRIDDRPIRLREPITDPDAVVVADPTLLHQVDLFAGLDPGDFLLLNTSRDLADLGLGDLLDRLGPEHVVSVPATEMARQHLGRPMPNAALLGAFAALTGQVSLGSVTDAIGERFPGAGGSRQRRAAEAAHAHVRAQIEARDSARGGRPVLSQIEGSQAVARAVTLCRPTGDRGLPDLPADPRRGVALRPCPHRRARRVRVPHGGVGVQRTVGLHRRLGRRRPQLHRDLQPGAALHGRGAVERLRSRSPDRDDAGQPGRRALPSTSGTTTPTPWRCATPAGSSCSPSPTRTPSTCTCRRSGSRSRCRCR